MAAGKGSLEERQNRCLEVWVNNPTMSYEEIAKQAGVDKRTFYRYRQNPDFMRKYQAMCRERFNGFESLAIEKLKEALEKGDFKAVKYTLDGLGYAATQKIDANIDGGMDITVSIDD